MSNYNDFLNDNSIFILKKTFPELTDEKLLEIYSLDFDSVTDKLTAEQKNFIYSNIFVCYYMINSEDYSYKCSDIYKSLHNAILELNK